MKKLFAIFSVAIFITLAAQAADQPVKSIVLDPATLRVQLLKGNLSLVQQEKLVEDAKTSVSLARAGLFPSLNLFFLNLFMPERRVNATLILRKTTIDFVDESAALLDERYNTLKGDTVFNTHAVDLECERTAQGTPKVQWICKITAGDAVNTVVFGLDR